MEKNLKRQGWKLIREVFYHILVHCTCMASNRILYCVGSIFCNFRVIFVKVFKEKKKIQILLTLVPLLTTQFTEERTRPAWNSSYSLNLYLVSLLWQLSSTVGDWFLHVQHLVNRNGSSRCLWWQHISAHSDHSWSKTLSYIQHSSKYWLNYWTSNFIVKTVEICVNLACDLFVVRYMFGPTLRDLLKESPWIVKL